MEEKKEVNEKTEVMEQAEVVTGEVEDNEMVVTLSKPYKFEGKEYDRIDLSGLEDLTAEDMIATNKILDRGGNLSFNPEMTVEYACVISARATKQPIEFFKGLRPKDAIKVKNKVMGFLYGAD